MLASDVMVPVLHEDAVESLDPKTMALLETIVEEHGMRRVAKRCPRCEMTKPLSEFNRSRTRGDGVQQYCRACWSARIEEMKSRMSPAERHRWEHDRYLRHRPKNVRRHWRNWNKRRLTAPDLYVDDIDREKVYVRDNGLCGICRAPIDLTLPPQHGDSFTIDHIKPLSAGGEHSYENVRAAHLRCNASEGQRQRKRLGKD